MFHSRTKRVALAAASVVAATALALTGCASTAPASSYDPDAKVTLNFTWWGNDDRAERYNTLIEKFNEEYPNITINGTFTDFPSYWEKRQTEAAGGGLPDVWQFSDSYLRQYAEPGFLLDLETQSEYIDFDAFEESLRQTGQLNDTQWSLPTGYSAWSVFQNDELLDAAGIEHYEGGTDWQGYSDYMASVTEASGGALYGGTDYTQRIQNFELQLRQEGGNLYTDDGQLGFDEDQLREFWESGAPDRDGVTVPQSRLEEINPVSGFGGKLAAADLTWSNFLASYLAESGSTSVSLVAPPTSDPSVKDLYRQGGLQMAISKTTKHPEAAAIFLNYVVNSPEAGEIFGTSVGFPASSTKLEGAVLEGPDAQVADYLDSVADRIGDAPPIPVVGYGSLEQTFWDLGKSIGLGAVSVDDAVTQFFDEASVVLVN